MKILKDKIKKRVLNLQGCKSRVRERERPIYLMRLREISQCILYAGVYMCMSYVRYIYIYTLTNTCAHINTQTHKQMNFEI